MSETNNNTLKTSERQITVSCDNMWFYNFIGDDFYIEPKNYTIGAIKTNIDNTIQFTAPNSTNNAFYNEMLTAQEVELNTFIHTGIGEGFESWYKIRTNASSAHKNNGKGNYNIIIYSGSETTPNKFIYDINGKFVASDVTGSQQTSVSLDFGQTYYIRLSATEMGSLMLAVSYDNDGGETGSYTSKIVNNSLCIDCNAYNTSNLIKNKRFKKAELTLYQKSSVGVTENYFKLGAFDYNETIYPGCSIVECGDLIDCVKISQANGDGVVAYTFDVTELFEKAVEEDCYRYIWVKAINNSSQDNSYITVYGKNSDYPPKVTVSCESNYGVNTNYRSDSHELGRFGQGSIDLQYGNLMFESEDFAWGGNRMPVTIKHLYNSLLFNQQYTAKSSIGLNTAEFGAMKLGLGYKLNIMQSMCKNDDENYYVYTGENGEEIYFKQTNEDIYKTSEEDGELEYNVSTRILDNGDKYLFDGDGRLIKITDDNNNSIEIIYTDDRITTVKDAVNREFSFLYDDNGYLTSITAPDGTQITYTYASDLLTAVNYPNGKSAQITYTSKKPTAITLYDNGVAVQKMAYTFNNYSVIKVEEYGYKDGVSQTGITKTYTYSQSAGRTVVHSNENSGNTVYVFDNNGEIVSEYFTTNSFGDNNVLLENGGGVTTVSNCLVGHNFEDVSKDWYQESANSGNLTFELIKAEDKVKYGKHYLKITSNNSGAVRNGIYQCSYMPDGDFTFSAYMRVVSGFEGEDDGAYLSIYQSSETAALVNSEKLKIPDDEFVRVSATFNGGDTGFCAAIMLDGAGVVEVYAPQFEYGAAPNSYNHISDSSFNIEGSWTLNGAEYYFEGGSSSFSSLKIMGDVNTKKYAGQVVTVKSAESTRETFKLSGWAKGYALPTHDGAEENPTFRLRAVVNYADGTTNETPITADFCPYTSDWQYTSVEFAKEAFKEVLNIQVFCDYDYNYDDAYFDDIELIRTQIETGLKEEDFAVEEDYTDESGTTTEDNQNQAEETEEFNAFNELVDAFGNTLTETTFTEGEFGTIYRSFGYDEEGNNLVKETDARGYTTQYVVDKTTSQNKEVTDRLGNKTVYEYDQSGRTTKVTSKNAKNKEIGTVSYSYNSYDDLTEIVRGDGLKYLLKYNAFRNLESIGIDGKEDGDLIKYTYTRGGRINSMTYANGDKMSAYYDGQGNMISETWVDKDKNEIAYYQYGYNAQGEIVRTVDKLAKKLYNYTYDNGRIEQAVESEITFDDYYNLINSKTVISTIRYYYDNEGTLTKKRIISPDGKEQVITYTATENESQLVKTTVGEHSFVSTSKNDVFGRKEFDELQLGSGFVSRQFDYLNGAVTDEHKDNKLLKSTPTTQLVSEITFSDGRTIDYEYDAEERITKVTDSVDGITRYTYDALGQLLTETKNGQLINSMIYDRYGNILHKNGIDYGYNGIWKDRLSHYDGKEITYDAQGNPLKYLDHILFWEKGRQLKSFDNSVYTYNANGIRTSKTIDGIRHDFYLDGGKILKETWLDNTLETVFDNEDSVCGIVYNGEPFYFQKNLQGDIIGITDQNANVVVRYSYDAWGKCTITRAINGVIARINPFRYRGYYYDSETGLYYLQSRYYDPVVGRFLNGDQVEFAVMQQGAIGHNLFAYCGNDCVNESDQSGYLKVKTWVVATALDVLFTLLNHAMMLGYISFSATIWLLARTPFTRKAALTFLQKKIIPVFIRGFFNKALTALRKVLVTFGRIGKEFAKEWTKDKAVSLLNKLFKTRLFDVLTSLLTWGGIIALMFDLLDKKFDGYITV